MRQGENENDSAYMRRFKVNLDTLLSAGKRHILCSPELVEATDKKNITNEEREKEESKFNAIIFLKRSDPIRYGSFLTELQNSAHLNRDEYPVTEIDVLDFESWIKWKEIDYDKGRRIIEWIQQNLDAMQFLW